MLLKFFDMMSMFNHENNATGLWDLWCWLNSMRGPKSNLIAETLEWDMIDEKKCGYISGQSFLFRIIRWTKHNVFTYLQFCMFIFYNLFFTMIFLKCLPSLVKYNVFFLFVAPTCYLIVYTIHFFNASIMTLIFVNVSI